MGKELDIGQVKAMVEACTEIIEDRSNINNDSKTPTGQTVKSNACADLSRGSRVRVLELQARPELNGSLGTLGDFAAQKQRWHVRLDSGSCHLFRPANLELA